MIMELSYDLKHSLFSVFLNAISAALAFAMQYLIVRIFGISKYGSFAFLNATLMVLSAFCVFGLNNYSTRYFASNHTPEEEGRVASHLASFVLISSLFGLGCFIPLTSLTNWVTSTPLIAVSTYFLARNLLVVISSAVQAKGNTICARLISPVGPSFITVGVLASIWIFGPFTNLEFRGLWYLICFAHCTILGAILITQSTYLSNVGRQGLAFNSITWALERGKYFFLANASVIIQQRIPVIVCGFVLFDKTTGALNLILQISTMSLLVMSAANQVLAPRLAKFYSTRSKTAFFKTVRFSILTGASTSAVFLMFIVFCGDRLLLFVTEDIPHDAHNALIVLAIGQFLNAMTGPIGFALSMSDQEKMVANVEWITALLSLFLLLNVMPQFGLIGTSYVISFVVVFRNVCLTALSYHKMRFHTSIFVFVREPTMIKS